MIKSPVYTIVITDRARHRLGILIPQTLQPTPHLTLAHQRAFINPTAYTFSDAAFNLLDTDVGIVHTHQ